MSVIDSLQSLNDLDLSDLDFDNLGSWPPALKVIVGFILWILIFTGGYYYHVEGLQH